MLSQAVAFIRAQEFPAWLVGGYVRDQLLGRPNHDLDVIVPEGGIQLARKIAAAFNGAFFVLDKERDVGRAILRDESGEALDVDVARLRAPELLDDLALRDFTINAIAVDISAGAPTLEAIQESGSYILDPFDGRADLRRGLLRVVTEGAFQDDPLRMLRGVRQAVELGFQIERATLYLTRRDAPLLTRVASERVRDELLRIISAPGAWQHVRLLATLDLLRYVLPEAAATIGVEQSPPHYLDVFDHTRAVMAHLEVIYAILWPESGYTRPQQMVDDPIVIAPAAQWAELAEMLAPYTDDLRAHLSVPLAAGRMRRDWLFWAALAHDWGKPATRSLDTNGRIRFLKHEHQSALLVEQRAQALKLASNEIAYLSRLVDQHMRPTFLAHDYPPSRRAVYRFFRDVGTAGPDCVLLSLADHMATSAADPNAESWQRRLETTRLLLEAYFRERSERVDPLPLLNGRQIMAECGIAPGPQVGRLLEGLREAQAIGEVTTVDQARAWVADQIRRGE